MKVWEEAAAAVPTAGGIVAIATGGGQRPDWRQAKGAAADRRWSKTESASCSHTYTLKAAAAGGGGGGGNGGGAAPPPPPAV